MRDGGLSDEFAGIRLQGYGKLLRYDMIPAIALHKSLGIYFQAVIANSIDGKDTDAALLQKIVLI